MAAIFSTLCVPSLKDEFVMPLLTTLGMQNEYTNESKLNALLSPESDRGKLCRQGVLERYGADNFVVLCDRISDILGQDNLGDELSMRIDDVDALCKKL